ncbi:hypothetical protein [Marinobacter subterrani]|uniref:hypothetical protein n=1 Tax=Marinobacter subterrani TaxID=1658765 RepID=UPI0023556F5F|nr:hypothetical protein [Marinobacter subterrani]
MSDDDKTESWVDKAQASVEKGLEFIKEHGSELFGKALTVTGVVAATSYAATFFGVELQDGAGLKLAVAAVVAGYKIFSAIQEYRRGNQAEERNDMEVISIEDYRALQSNLDQVLHSHEAVIYALEESQDANARLLKANEDLLGANEQLRGALRQKHRAELDAAESAGLIERVDFKYDENESIVGFTDDTGSGEEAGNTSDDLEEESMRLR